jgi:ribonuclease HI
MALIHAAKIASLIGVGDVVLLGDSAVVVSQANGTAKCRSAELRLHLAVFKELTQKFERIRIRRVSRHQNLAGIALAKARF